MFVHRVSLGRSSERRFADGRVRCVLKPGQHVEYEAVESERHRGQKAINVELIR